MGLSLQQILVLGLQANISGAIGCYLFGYLIKNDKLTIILTLTVVILILLISINTNQSMFILYVIIATFYRSTSKLEQSCYG